MPYLTKLNLSEANLIFINSDMIHDCKYLQSLDLSLNKKVVLESLNNLSLRDISNLKYLGLRGNNIYWLENPLIDSLKQFTKLQIDFHDNQFFCNCSVKSQVFTRWFIEMGSKGNIKDYNKHTYYCSGPSGLIFYNNIIDLDQFYASCDTVKIRILLIVKSVLGTLSTFILIGFIYLLQRYWWRIRYYFFCLEQKIKRDKESENNLWVYDAFISYCAEDRFWVHGTLMKELEKEYGFHLCIHYRDFPLGGAISETIIEKMTQSREIIIILSDIAITSNWCQFELDQALLLTSLRKKSLITITLGDIQNHCLDPKIAHLLDSHTFLRFHDDEKKSHKLFWKQLVAQIYNDPRGQSCLCCCPYGASSLGYRDIVDTMADDECTEHSYQVKNV
jgi:hypothetical protein